MLLAALRRYLVHETGEFVRALDEALDGCDSVLDVGCGASSPVRSLARRPRRLVGVDGFPPSIEASRRAGIHDDYVCMPLTGIDGRFGDGEFDAVVLLDVVEHFEKRDAEALLAAAERIAARRVVLFTPNGFLRQGEHGGNPYQVHRSGWTTAEMRDRGYRVMGINGWRPLRGDLAAVRFRPRPIWEAISRLTQPVVRRRPERAFQLLCVRDRPGPS